MALDADGRLNEDKQKTKLQRARRLAWMLGIGVLAIAQLATGSGLSQADRFASKISLVVLGVVLWHLGRSQLFFYFDLKAWTDTIWAGDDAKAKALVVLAYAMLFGLLAVAIVVGMTTGL